MQKRDRDAIAEYRESHPCCQVAGWWHQVCGPSIPAEYKTNCDRYREATYGGWLECPQVHHIVGGQFKYDLPCNLLTICGFSHGWIHDTDPIAGKIVSWRVKLSIGEFDPVMIREFWQRDVAGWLEKDSVLLRCELSERLEQWRRELVEKCEATA